MVKALLGAVAIAWFVAAGARAAHEHGGGAVLGASAAFDADGRLFVVYKQDDQAVVRRSDDAGQSWTPPRAVSPPGEPVATGGDSRPKIATGPGGRVYVTWTRPLARPYTGEIRFARSADGGETFSAATTVHSDRQEITHRFDALAVGPGGRVFVAWIDKRDLELAKARGAPYRGAAVYLSRSDDHGETFDADLRIADHSCECCRIALLPEADGGVVALWRHVFDPDIRDHAWTRVGADGRVGAPRRATFDGWRLDACPHHGPSLGADSTGRLHAVWFTQAPGQAGVHYGRLMDGAVDGQRRIGGDTAEHADLAVSGMRVAVAWKEFDGERTHLRALRSDDGGNRWREVSLASTDGASDQPRVLVHAGRFHVFWQTRADPFGIWALP